MKKQHKQVNLATEILSEMKQRLIICRIALIISLIANIIQGIIIFR